MKDVYELLRELKNIGAKIYSVDNKIKVDAKTGTLTEEISERIKYHRDEILAIIEETSKKSEFVHIEKATHQENYPISDAQRRMWVLSQFNGVSMGFNIPNQAHLNQDIDINCFKRAIYAVIDRHEILRTVFKANASGEIRQWILASENLNFEIEYKDLRKEQHKQEWVQSYINEDVHKTFDLANGPLIRACLIQMEDASYVFYYNMHHIISDGWSMEILFKDVLSYYKIYKENRESDPVIEGLEELKIQYKDYSVWQLDQHTKELFKGHRSYWLNKLSGELPILDLRGGKLRPKVMTYNGHALSTYIDPDITTRLRTYSKKNGGSLFMGLLAAWNILMYRYSDQRDIITGSPVAGRAHADLNDQIGCYVNTLVLRNQIDPEESFDKFFLKVKQTTLDAYAHQLYPFDKLLDDLNLQRDVSRNPLFDILLGLDNNKENIKTIDRIENGPSEDELNKITDAGSATSIFDMRLSFQEIDNYLSLHILYNRDVFDQKMIEGFIKHYRQLLDALLKNPHEKISHLNYLSLEESQELLFTLNKTEVNYSQNKTIIDLFHDQVAKTPDNIALIFGEKKCNYHELNEKSNQLADYLQRNYHLKPDDLVGIIQARSEWVIISILAVLKTGAAYVPIDIEYPQDRINFIKEDTKCTVFIDEAELKNFIHNQEKYGHSTVISSVQSNNLAYVIYTSGSTGKPKGVMIEHRSVVNTLLSQIELFNVDKQSKGLQLASISFDASVSEIFTMLLSGGSLCIVDKADRNDPQLLSDFMNKHGISIATIPPSYLSKIDTSKLKELKTLITAGESAVYEDVVKYAKNNGTYYNAYGPTEASICGTVFKLQNPKMLIFDSIPIGKPIANTQIYILNEAGQLQPKGAIGEIYIGGAGLARGYLNREELTKEKFIQHPFEKEKRLYRTGDLGRWLPDGNIEFVGRNDEQVKIRGHRIELGEIEYTLLKKEQISEAVVIAKKNQENENDLVAYLVANSEQTATELKLYLQNFLPDYMMPAYFVQVDSLPLTSNGKIDKRALPDPDGMGLKSGVDCTAPRNAIEKKLLKIWQDILRRDDIGVRDNFFAIGGHSLKAIRVISKIQKEYDIKFEVAKMFELTTIEQIAEFISILTTNHSTVDSEMEEFKI